MGNDEKSRNHLGEQKDQSVETQREDCECLSDVRFWGLVCVWGMEGADTRWKKMPFYWMSNAVMISGADSVREVVYGKLNLP